MVALLTGWLDGAEAVDVIDAASVSVARRRIRELGAELAMPEPRVEELALVASELGQNQLRHARGGVLGIRAIHCGGVPGIELTAADRGVGIADPARALHGASSGGGSLGVGLAAVLRNADEVDFDVRLGEGSCVWARKFAGRVRRRPVVGCFGCACPGETEMGDAAAFVRRDERLLVALIDGLGHGPPARDAALQAAATLRAEAHRGPSAVLAACDVALAQTRGAVMTVLSVDDQLGELEHAAAGNVVTRVCRPRVSETLMGRSLVLGQRVGARRFGAERRRLEPHDVVMMFTDGLKSSATLSEELALMRDHPLLMAHHLYERHGRGRDDALAVVIRM